MKKSIALLAVLAASAVAYNAFKKISEDKKNAVSRQDKSVHLALEPVLPNLPQSSSLNATLLQSYRVQCQVMMECYPKGTKVIIKHQVEFKDSNQLLAMVQGLNDVFTADEDLARLSVILHQTIDANAQAAFDSVVSIAQTSLTFEGNYQGWIIEKIN